MTNLEKGIATIFAGYFLVLSYAIMIAVSRK